MGMVYTTQKRKTMTERLTYREVVQTAGTKDEENG